MIITLLYQVNFSAISPLVSSKGVTNHRISLKKTAKKNSTLFLSIIIKKWFKQNLTLFILESKLMFGFCKINEKTGFIWICKRLFRFDFEDRKIINQHDFEDYIIGKSSFWSFYEFFRRKTGKQNYGTARQSTSHCDRGGQF